MRPLFFGSSEKPLFGVFHPPAGGGIAVRERGGVLICSPFGREYLRAHRALRELAERLSEEGLTSLRFDHYGCGDSAGEGEEADLPQWVEDIEVAAEELADSASTEDISAVGLRLGAALAVLAAERGGTRFSRLVLWEPVVVGARYLEELAVLQEAWSRSHPPPSPAARTEGANGDVLGFPLPPSLREAVAAVDLRRVAKAPARKVLIVSSEREGDTSALRERLLELGAEVSTIHAPSQTFWLRQEGIEDAVVPRETIGAIARWLGSGGAR